jgi:hypothetical protein
MVLYFKIKISSMKHGRFIFYSNEGYVVATHKSGVLFFSNGHGFFIGVHNVLHVWKKLEKNILIDGVNFKILRPNILVLLGMFMGNHGLHLP